MYEVRDKDPIIGSSPDERRGNFAKSMDISNEFNTWQSGYTGKILRWVPHYQELLGSVLESLASDFTPSHILDLGCGNGNGTDLLMRRFPGASFTLVDASEEMLEACRERFKDRPNAIRYVQGLFQDIELEAESADLAIAVLAFHHLKGEEKQALFPSLCSWLRPGGRLAYADLFASKRSAAYPDEVLIPWERYAKSRGTEDQEWDALMDHHAKYDFPDSYADTLAWLESAGFQNCRIALQKGPWGMVQGVRGVVVSG
jgi:tRNA (cmo5U34)-methyltransferase